MTSGSRAQSARRTVGLAAGLLAAAGLGVPAGANPPAPPAPKAEPLVISIPTPPGPGATETVHRPSAANRIVRLFDFEEPGNPYPVPAHWSHAQDDPNGPPSARRPGFPQWNRAEFYYKDAVSGKACVEVPTHGGSACLRLDPGEVPIFPDADYTVSAKVKTLDLEHGRAFLTARLLDQRLRPIAGSEARSEPILSPTGWTTATVVVAGRFPEAAWLQIDLELLQPEMFTPPPTETMAEHTVVHADVSGAALFDDVSIALLPRTRFWSTEPTGLFVAPQKATLGMLARDQGGEQLHARVVITDVDGRRVAQQSFALDPSAHPTMWSPSLPGLGWYRAVMDIDAGGPGDGGAINVSRSEVWFATLPEPLKLSQSAVRNADFARFGIAADRLPEPLLERLVPLVGRTHTRFLSLPAFDARTPVGQEKADLARRSPTIERLIVQGQEITLVVGDVPPSVAAKETLDPTDALGMAALDPAIWGAFVEPTLDALGQRILRYQLGHTDDTHALRRPAGAGLEGFEVFSARLVPGPKIALPWRADYTFPSFQRSAGAKVDSGRPNSASNVAPGPLVDAMPTIYPLGFPVEAMADLARAWRERCRAGEAFELTVVPELPDMARFGPRARAVVAARKIAEFWRTMSADGDPRIGAGANAPSTPPPRIALNAPWKIAPAGSGSAAEEFAILPAPELGVTALMAERLAGRRVVGSIPAAPGVHAFLIAERAGASSLAGLGTGLGGEALVRAGVVAWNDSASPDHAFVEVYPLRESVTVVDMFGNATTMDAKPARGAPAGPGDQVRVALGEAPVFIEGVDPYLAQFTSSIRVTPSFIPAVVTEHEQHIELTNPWPVRITGHIQLRDESSTRARADGRPVPRSAPWRISPNICEFAAAPGQTISLPITIDFGPGQIAGTKDLEIVARVLADRPYGAIHSTAMMEIGLPDLELSADLQLSPTPSGPDVIVVASVTNKDDHPRTLRLDISAQAIVTQTKDISDLPPGETQIKSFVIRDGARVLAGRFIRVTLGDDETAARLSKAVYVPADK